MPFLSVTCTSYKLSKYTHMHMYACVLGVYLYIYIYKDQTKTKCLGKIVKEDNKFKGRKKPQ